MEVIPFFTVIELLPIVRWIVII